MIQQPSSWLFQANIGTVDQTSQLQPPTGIASVHASDHHTARPWPAFWVPPQSAPSVHLALWYLVCCLQLVSHSARVAMQHIQRCTTLGEVLYTALSFKGDGLGKPMSGSTVSNKCAIQKMLGPSKYVGSKYILVTRAGHSPNVS
jgi:hypothetical protein